MFPMLLFPFPFPLPLLPISPPFPLLLPLLLPRLLLPLPPPELLLAPMRPPLPPPELEDTPPSVADPRVPKELAVEPPLLPEEEPPLLEDPPPSPPAPISPSRDLAPALSCAEARCDVASSAARQTAHRSDAMAAQLYAVRVLLC